MAMRVLPRWSVGLYRKAGSGVRLPFAPNFFPVHETRASALAVGVHLSIEHRELCRELRIVRAAVRPDDRVVGYAFVPFAFL